MEKAIDTPVVASRIDFTTTKDLNRCNNRKEQYSQKAGDKIAKSNVDHFRIIKKKGKFLDSYFSPSHPCDTKGKVYMFEISVKENGDELISTNPDGSEHLVALPCPDFCTNSIPDEN